ncbi:MAG: hypothetical protein J7604_08495 [Sporocytophaga sp.]|uniref:hypothetical protein n=1 Tax=Sporocytophaga sp. TaxID=2231183 RepID=UPI001B129097|nr:hypothetical protein [Sporocytophaga sp.]MBO9700235.1 hypothetical protein [Sporocytophaga sp.]
MRFIFTQLIILFLSSIMHFSSQAQDDLYGEPRKKHDTIIVKLKEPYIQGKIVTLSDETINCFIFNQGHYYEGKIKYKWSINDKKALKIKSDNIKHLSIDTVTYDRISYGSFSYLMLKLVNGPVKLYDNISLKSTGPILLPFGSPASITFIEKRCYIVKNSNVYKLSRYTFRDDLKKVFAGNDTYLKLLAEAKYGDFIKDLEKIISGYNDELLKGTIH